MRSFILNKRNRTLILLSIVIVAIVLIFLLLYNSSYLNISQVIISCDEGETPPSVVKYLNKYNDMNILKINCGTIEDELELNPFIESAKATITISKKLRINLKKIKVNAIIHVIESNSYALLSEKGISKINEDDISLLDTHLITIEMLEDVLNALLKQDNLGKFNNFIEKLDLLNEFAYLISSVKYDNNVNNSFGFFELEIENTNTVIRVREQVSSQILLKAISFAQKGSLNKEEKTVLDVYHGAIIERYMPFGG